MTDNFYHGPRWMGLWNNPNLYGMLMGAGFMLSICQIGEQRQRPWRLAWSVAAGLMVVGLIFSYSRGAWCGVGCGLLYFGKMRGGKLIYHRRVVLLTILAVSAALSTVSFFWNFETDRWYLIRLNLNQASCQNRIVAWTASTKIIRDHLWRGVGWNKATAVYEQSYLAPAEGGAAIATNDYLMLGTQLGLPALLCFIGYLWSNLKKDATDSSQIACRAGVVTLLAAFWFDDGLFNLPTACMFWMLLESGAGVPPNEPAVPDRVARNP